MNNELAKNRKNRIIFSWAVFLFSLAAYSYSIFCYRQITYATDLFWLPILLSFHLGSRRISTVFILLIMVSLAAGKIFLGFSLLELLVRMFFFLLAVQVFFHFREKNKKKHKDGGNLFMERLMSTAGSPGYVRKRDCALFFIYLFFCMSATVYFHTFEQGNFIYANFYYLAIVGAGYLFDEWLNRGVAFLLCTFLASSYLVHTGTIAPFIIFQCAGLLAVSYIMGRFKNKEYKFFSRIKSLVLTDHLTGLYNNHFFINFTDNFLQENPETKSAVIFLDMDDFKSINDCFGHSTGDAYLRNFSEKLKEKLPEDAVAARMGGDEFMVFISETNRKKIKSLCRDLLETGKNLEIEKIKMTVTLSIGAALFPQGGKTARELINNADLAMYNAKKTGKNMFMVYDEHMENIKNRSTFL